MRDVLVAGGGPAGLAAAIYAATAGLRVTVVEPRQAPLDKACGEGLMPGGVTALARLGVHPAGQQLQGIRYVDGPHVAEARFAHGPGLGVRRTTLHRALLTRAQDLGVEHLTGRVDDLTQDETGVTAAGLRARWLVAADGLHSPLRRRLGLDVHSSGPRRYGIRRHHALTPWTDLVEVHWSADAEAYVTPVDDATVGVAVLFRHRPDIPADTGYDALLSRFPDLTARLHRSRACTAPAGAGPFRQRARRRTAGRVLLVGDAAGYCDALTGEGVALALRTAEAAVACLLSGHLDAYERAWVSVTRRYRLLTAVLLAARGRPALRARLVPAAARTPWLFHATVNALA